MALIILYFTPLTNVFIKLVEVKQMIDFKSAKKKLHNWMVQLKIYFITNSYFVSLFTLAIYFSIAIVIEGASGVGAIISTTNPQSTASF